MIVDVLVLLVALCIVYHGVLISTFWVFKKVQKKLKGKFSRKKKSVESEKTAL